MTGFCFAKRIIRGGAFCTVAAIITISPAAFSADAAVSGVPDFMGTGAGWNMVNSNATDYVDPPTGAKPVTNDPGHPHIGNLQPGQKTDRVADLNSPILKDWAKAQMKKTNGAVLRGRTPFVATSLCWPGGVPAQLLVPTKVFFLQTPGEVWMIWERDQLVRRVYLDRQHSANPKPDWFGESVGHYENGDTLVIDTIGLTDHPLSFVDNYRTPHTKQLHVVERWKINGGGKTIEVSFRVEDPGAFNMPWGGIMRYRKGNNAPIEEFVCAENNRDYFGLDDYKIPTAVNADF
jgi:hypothetical protein